MHEVDVALLHPTGPYTAPRATPTHALDIDAEQPLALGIEIGATAATATAPFCGLLESSSGPDQSRPVNNVPVRFVNYGAVIAALQLTALSRRK